jgi:hypothetical protein
VKIDFGAMPRDGPYPSPLLIHFSDQVPTFQRKCTLYNYTVYTIFFRLQGGKKVNAATAIHIQLFVVEKIRKWMAPNRFITQMLNPTHSISIANHSKNRLIVLLPPPPLLYLLRWQ